MSIITTTNKRTVKDGNNLFGTTIQSRQINCAKMMMLVVVNKSDGLPLIDDQTLRRFVYLLAARGESIDRGTHKHIAWLDSD